VEIRATRVYVPASADASTIAVLAQAAGSAWIPTVTGASSGATRIFNGDFSTGNASQWVGYQSRLYNSTGSGYTGNLYSLTFVSDPNGIKGTVARFEVRTGDVPNFGGGERSEVASNDTPGGVEGQTLWYSHSIMFASNFDMANTPWCVTGQWHADDGTSWAPCIAFGGASWNPTKWMLQTKTVSANAISIWETPLTLGAWHDVIMQVHWSTNPANGFINLWHNGSVQTFLDGTTTWRGQTMSNGQVAAYCKDGLYRNSPTTPTGIVYACGFRCATTQAGL